MTGVSLTIPTLETARLRLRAARWSDFEAYAAFRGSERARTLGGPFSRAEAFDQMAELVGHWQLRGFGRWMVADRASDAPLGVVGLYFPESWPEPEIAWSVFAEAEGRGVAREAAEASRRYAYDVLGWQTVMSLIARGNDRSAALARGLGAWIDGTFDHPQHGHLDMWRHPSAASLRTGAA